MRHLLLLLLVACSASPNPGIGDAAAQCEPGVRYECDCGTGRPKGQALCSKAGTRGGCECQSDTDAAPEDDGGAPDATDACAVPPTSVQPVGLDCEIVPGACPSCAGATRYSCFGDTQPTPALSCVDMGKAGLYREHCCAAACVRISRADTSCGSPGRQTAYSCPADATGPTVPTPGTCLQATAPVDGNIRLCCAP